MMKNTIHGPLVLFSVLDSVHFGMILCEQTAVHMQPDGPEIAISPHISEYISPGPEESPSQSMMTWPFVTSVG
jgi:hypothetical protein